MSVKLPSIETVFSEAIEIVSEVERSAYLDGACGGDLSLRRKVESLLDAHVRAGGFLQTATEPDSFPRRTTAPNGDLGATVGPYRLLEEIGEGGMGAVYMAEQTHPVRRKVALKLIKPGMDSKQIIARFEIERQVLAMMDHPNIARVHDAGAADDGRPYFVMELVRGVPITDYCDRERLTITERLELFILVCRAVQHAHQKGIIHRDLKPSNILVTVVDGAAVPKVIDFGIAKATGQALTDKTCFTAFAQFLGTPMYMSPEQADLACVDVDTRSDVYSLGVLLYELMTGTTPFESETFRKAAFDEIRRIIREEEPPKPSTRLSTLGATQTTVSENRSSDARRLDRFVRGELDWIVMKALDKNRQRRYETANDFAADVMRFLNDQPVEARSPSAGYRFAKYARRNRVMLTTASLVAGALLVGLAASIAMTFRAIKAEEKTAAALGLARDHLKEAHRQRAYARKAVDEMYTQVAEKWLELDGRLTPLQRGFLEKALAFYEEFAVVQADDPEARAEAARAAARVGDIQGQLGQSAEAIQSHRRALEAFRLLSAEFPDQPEYRRGVARNLKDIGLIHELLGQIRDADEEYQEALSLRERLAEAPGLPDDRAELAAILRALAGVTTTTGLADVGERHALRSLELLTRLVAEHPMESRYQGQLADSEHQLAWVYGMTDRFAEAEAPDRRALVLRQLLADADPADPKLQYAVAKSRHNLGGFYRVFLDDAKSAAEEYRLALTIEEKLAADHPNIPRYRELLTQSHLWLFEMNRSLGLRKEAEATLRRAREVAAKLAADFPGVPAYQSLVIEGWSRQGRFAADGGRNPEAREAFERACEMSRALARDNPTNWIWRHKLASNCYQAAVNHATLVEPEKRDFLRALELARESVEIEPGEPGFWKGLALTEYRAGDYDAALKSETKCLELRKNEYSEGYAYDWLLMTLIHMGRGDRMQARKFAKRILNDGTPGAWQGHEADFDRLARESEPKLRALLAEEPDPKPKPKSATPP